MLLWVISEVLKKGAGVSHSYLVYWRKFGWWVWQISGVREICAIINPNWKAATEPKASTFVLWVVGVYVALFGLASQRHESRQDQIENRANGIYAQLGAPNAKRALARIPRAQAMTLPRKPNLWPPQSVLRSLVGKEVRDEETVLALIEAVETFKEDLEVVNLAGASLIGANLTGANLNRAILIEAFLITTTLALADLTDADLSRANLYCANLTGAKLIRVSLVGADLRGANLSSANLFEARLAGDVVSADDSKYVSAYWDHKTTWPEDFTPPCPSSTPEAPCKSKK
jgi:hypothetical protein